MARVGVEAFVASILIVTAPSRSATSAPGAEVAAAKRIAAGSVARPSGRPHVIAGEGWGCAHLPGRWVSAWQCWEAGPAPHAWIVPWIEPGQVAAGPDRVCVVSAAEPSVFRCWRRPRRGDRVSQPLLDDWQWLNPHHVHLTETFQEDPVFDSSLMGEPSPAWADAMRSSVAATIASGNWGSAARTPETGRRALRCACRPCARQGRGTLAPSSAGLVVTRSCAGGATTMASWAGPPATRATSTDSRSPARGRRSAACEHRSFRRAGRWRPETCSAASGPTAESSVGEPAATVSSATRARARGTSSRMADSGRDRNGASGSMLGDAGRRSGFRRRQTELDGRAPRVVRDRRSGPAMCGRHSDAAGSAHRRRRTRSRPIRQRLRRARRSSALLGRGLLFAVHAGSAGPVTFEPVASGDVAIVGNPKRRACSPIAPALAPCPAGTTGRPWAEILPAAASSAGKIVTVRGPLGVGPLLQVNESSEDDPFDYDSDPRAVRFHADLLLDGASQPLVLWGLGCEGDGSGACCDAPAYGETVVVTGRLVAGPLRAGGVFDWHLYATAACAAAPGQTP